MDETRTYTAFCEHRRVASGALPELLAAVRTWAKQHGEAGLLYFDDTTGKQVDFNLREEPVQSKTGPGRPKLGVVAREVTLLPRHWEWLEAQPNGASAALRRLVDLARQQPGDSVKRAREASGRFLTAMAGNLPGYEEVTRALYAGDRSRFSALMEQWPDDIREHAERLAGAGI